jgi:hypothetical protein
LLRRIFPKQVLTTRQIGRAMIDIVRLGFYARIPEAKNIRAASQLDLAGVTR